MFRTNRIIIKCVVFFEFSEDICVIFEEVGGSWSVTIEPEDLNVHHQYGIKLKTPKYRNLDILDDVWNNIGMMIYDKFINIITVYFLQVKVHIKLYRRKDCTSSDPKEFTYRSKFSDEARKNFGVGFWKKRNQ